MTAETVLPRPAIEAGSISVEAPRFRYSPGQRLKVLLSGISIAAIGALAAAVIGPAFLQKGINMGLIGIGLYILPGITMCVAGSARAIEGITGRTNVISEIVESLAA